jgi:Holliday junction resolvasome RuvABC endonuclease subunit
MKVIALDLATSTGFAIGNTSDLSPATVTSGTILLSPRNSGVSLGAKCAALESFLRILIKDHQPDAIVREESLFRGLAASQHGFGFAAMVEKIAFESGLPCLSIPATSVKKQIAGSGKTDKEGMIAAVRELGFSPAGDDEADAIALLLASVLIISW